MNLTDPYLPGFIRDKFLEQQFKGEFTAIVLFCDISGFTPLTDSLLKSGKRGSEILSRILGMVYDPMIEIIYEHSGFISRFSGDAITAIFPFCEKKEDNDEIIQHAISAGNEILDFFSINKTIQTELGTFEIAVRIGLSEGSVEWGIVGSNKKLGYYFKGDALDNSVALEEKAHKGTMLASDFLKSIERKEILDRKKILGNFPEIHVEVFKSFFPDAFLSFEKGEFRQVATIFLSFNGELEYELLNELSNLILVSVIKFEGYLSNLSFGDKGALFIIFFGFPKAHEDDIKRTLSFVEEFRNRIFVQDIPITYRMGISYGLVYAGRVGGEKRAEFTCIGDVVNLASRLAFSGEISEILCTKEVAELASHFARIPLSALKQIKGKKERLPLYRFFNIKKNAGERHYLNELIGREKEIEKLKHLISGSILEKKFGGVVYIHGEPGIGKTRLLYEIRDWFEKEHIKFNWIRFPCDALVSRAWNGVIQWLKDYFDIKGKDREEDKSSFLKKINEISEDDDINELTRREISRTHSIVGAEIGIDIKGSLYEKLDSKLRYDNFVIGLKELLKALSYKSPVIIEIDDAQWIDKSTEEFLLPLTRNVKDSPFIIITACRYLEEGETVSFKISRDVQVEEIDLKILTEDEEIALIESILEEGQPSEYLREIIINTSNGNPFFIEQWLKHLKETNVIVLKENTWEIICEINDLPSSIDQVIIARIDSLGSRVKEILQSASIIGQKFPFKLLNEMLEGKYPIYEYLLSAESFKLVYQENMKGIVEEIVYFFNHALIKDVAYNMQLNESREKLHLTALRLIEKIYSDRIEEWYDDLCIHAERSNSEEKLKEYLEKNGDRYKKKFANKKAMENYEKLLSLNITREKYFEILLRIEEIYKLTGPFSTAKDYALKALEIAEEINCSKMIAASLIVLGKTYQITGEIDEAEKTLTKALKIHNSLDDKSGKASVLKTLGAVNYGKCNYTKSAEYNMKALKIYTELGDRRLQGLIFSDLGLINCRTGDYQKAMELLNKSIGISREIGNLYGESLAIGNLGTVHSLINDHDNALILYNKALELNKIIGNRTYESTILNNIATTHNERSNYAEALELFQKSLEIRREIGNRVGEGSVLSNIANIYGVLGDYRKALQILDESISISKETKYRFGEAIALKEIGIIYSVLGDFKKAHEFIMESSAILTEIGEKRYQAIINSDIGNLHLATKEYEKAIEIANQGLSIINEIGISTIRCRLILVLGKASLDKSELKKAEEYLRKAFELAEKDKDEYHRILSMISLAKLEFRKNNIEKGIELFEKGIESLRNKKTKSAIADSLIAYALCLLEYMPDYDNSKSKAVDLLKEAKRMNMEMQRHHKAYEIEDIEKKFLNTR